MVFRRRDRRPVFTALTEFFLPRGGWKRATQYVIHRLRRLPDPPHRIARGIFAGVFISFTPFFGLHFIGAIAIAMVIRGNVLAALLATFFGNPVTTPLIALGSVELGHMMLGHLMTGSSTGFGLSDIGQSFADAWHAITGNFRAMFTNDVANWQGLSEFFWEIFLPYLIGGLIPGILSGVICAYASLPIVGAYQKIRDRQRRERVEKAFEKRQKAAEKERRRTAKATGQPEDQA